MVAESKDTKSALVEQRSIENSAKIDKLTDVVGKLEHTVSDLVTLHKNRPKWSDRLIIASVSLGMFTVIMAGATFWFNALAGQKAQPFLTPIANNTAFRQEWQKNGRAYKMEARLARAEELIVKLNREIASLGRDRHRHNLRLTGIEGTIYPKRPAWEVTMSHTAKKQK